MSHAGRAKVAFLCWANVKIYLHILVINNMGDVVQPKSVISVMMIISLFLHRCFAALRAQWGSIVTEKQRNRNIGLDQINLRLFSVI
jgi:hypothetical protein